MNSNKIIQAVIIISFALFAWLIISTATSGYGDTEELVPCTDNQNREFEDELCKEGAACANWNLDMLFIFNQVKHCDAYEVANVQ